MSSRIVNRKHCIVVTCFAAGQPGYLDFAYRIRALATTYRLTVVSVAPITVAELQIPDAEYIVFDCGSGRKGWLRYLWQCSRLIRSCHPSVAVLLHSAAAPIALLAGNIPTVTYWNEHPTHFAPSPEGFAPLSRLTRAMVRWLFFRGARASSRVLPIGEAHRDNILDEGCHPKAVHLQYMGVDEFFRAAAQCKPTGVNHSSSPIKLLYVGTVAKARGRDIMIEALAIANQRHEVAHLTLVGASEEELRYCSDYAKRLGVSNSLRIVGRIPGTEIPNFMRSADVGLCLWEDRPWWRFNPPTKLFEYLVAGLPVLASNIRTHTAYIKDEVNGLIFEYEAQDLARVIKKLSAMQTEIASMKIRAAESGERYLWKRIEPDFLAVVAEASE